MEKMGAPEFFLKEDEERFGAEGNIDKTSQYEAAGTLQLKRQESSYLHFVSTMNAYFYDQDEALLIIGMHRPEILAGLFASNQELVEHRIGRQLFVDPDATDLFGMMSNPDYVEDDEELDDDEALQDLEIMVNTISKRRLRRLQGVPSSGSAPSRRLQAAPMISLSVQTQPCPAGMFC